MFNVSRALRERLDELERKYKALEESHEKLRRHVDLEWEDLKDKVHRWMQRTGARERAEARSVTSAPPLSNLDPVSARILAQRARRSVPALVPQASEGEEVG